MVYIAICSPIFKCLLLASALGATHIRQMVAWHLIHECRGPDGAQYGCIHAFASDPASGQHYADQLTQLVASARQRNMSVHLTLMGVASGWGVPRGCVPALPPTGLNVSLDSYRAFVTKWVTYFANLGVKRFSLWN